MQGDLAGRAGVFKGHCKGHSAKQITQKKRLSDFLTPAQKGQKEGSRFHPSKPAVILSGFAVSLFQALITGPQMRVAFGTANPATRRETGHGRMPVFVPKCLILALFRPLSS